MPEDIDPETKKLLERVKTAITYDKNAQLAEDCINFYVDEEYDAEGITEDVNDCKYVDGDGDQSQLIDRLSGMNKYKHLFATDEDKDKFAKLLIDAINGDWKPPTDTNIDSNFDINQIKWNLSRHEPTKAKEIITRQCPEVFDEVKEKAFMTVLAIGTKNNVPLLNWLTDTYQRYRINSFYEGKQQVPINTAQFHSQYELFKKLNESKDRKVTDKLEAAIQSFWKRLCPEISFQAIQVIDDSVNEFVDYYIAMNDAIERMLKKSVDGLAPCQIDLWIIPNNVESGIDGGDDSEDEEEQQDDLTDGIDKIGNIEQRFKANKDKFEYTRHDNLTREKASRTFVQTIEAQLNAKRSQRVMLYIDRRNPKHFDKMDEKEFANYISSGYGQNDEKYDKEAMREERRNTQKTWPDTLYIAQSKEKKYSELPKDYRSETSFWQSTQCMLPGMPKEKIKDAKYGVRNDFGGYQFTLSWHIESADLIRCYWFSNAWGSRFFPQDAVRLWPKYFKVNKKNKPQSIKKDKIDKLMKMRQVIDPGFETWYKQTTGKSLIV